MFHESFCTLFWREFKTLKQGAEFFHVTKPTVVRWLDGTVPVNPMAEKLLLIKSLGYCLMTSVGQVFEFVSNVRC